MSQELHQPESEDLVHHLQEEVDHAQEELGAGHEKEAQEILWKALGSASNLKDSKMATKILELLSEKGTQH